jgi:hypothetical protein
MADFFYEYINPVHNKGIIRENKNERASNREGTREREREVTEKEVEILDPFHDKRPYNILQAASFCPADLA